MRSKCSGRGRNFFCDKTCWSKIFDQILWGALNQFARFQKEIAMMSQRLYKQKMGIKNGPLLAKSGLRGHQQARMRNLWWGEDIWFRILWQKGGTNNSSSDTNSSWFPKQLRHSLWEQYEVMSNVMVEMKPFSEVLPSIKGVESPNSLLRGRWGSVW